MTRSVLNPLTPIFDIKIRRGGIDVGEAGPTLASVPAAASASTVTIPASAVAPTVTTFSPLSGIGWHAAYFAENLGYSNGATVSTWADDIGSEDLSASGTPTMVVSDSSFNNHRSVQWVNTATAYLEISNANHPSTRAQPYAYVVIFKFDSLPGSAPGDVPVIIDGVGTFQQKVRSTSGGAAYGIQAGGTERTGGTPDTNPHHLLAYFDGSSSRLEIDGSTVISGSTPGTDSHDGMRLGYHGSGATSNHRFDGRIAFAGVYYGDPESDGGWTSWKSWVNSFYGITVS